MSLWLDKEKIGEEYAFLSIYVMIRTINNAGNSGDR